ncbi:ABC transporter ATP-binding protein [Streptococcus equinus]|uniref:ABC transporter ATP-binding protein n=1 Tax=Streptococcus equinus TaxID=1335 RepID=UPI000674678E|nr:ABC transporter ATP-binding protein [Streptococcus equinus]QMS95783.1 nisin MDC transporter ATP-binding protein NmdT [Streptococcus equinus]SCW31540.1 ABC-type multidrug transport system, ATPase and permease component [Streptococcus equinus]SEK27231.1 ABC-type multidrug transport system, ATPase and permease component [Streptococcus equinus]SFQ62398.1 ABC-type multidrug transport system, ATPase and permease component [Streptococcus equinus]
MDKLTVKKFFQTIFTIPKTLKMIFLLEKKNALYLIVLNAILSLLPLANFFIYQELINSIFEKGNKIFYVLFIYALVQIFLSLLNQLILYIDSKFSMNLLYSLNLKVQKKISLLSLIDFEQSETYNLIENITQDSTYKPFQLFNAIIGVISAFLSLLTSIVYISTWSSTLAIFLLLIPITSLIIFLRVGQLEFMIQWSRVNSEREVWYINYLLTHDFSFKEIKLNGISQYFIQKYGKLKKSFIKQDLIIAKKKSIFNGGLDTVLNIINGVAIFTMVNSTRAGKLLVGNFVSLIQALTRVNTYSQTMIQNVYIIYNTSLFMEQLFNFLNMRVENGKLNLQKQFDLGESVNCISVRNLSFSYPENTEKSVSNVSVDFKKGELVAIVGKNGSGKSTFVKLLSGLYSPSEGEIFYDGKSNRALGLDFYQKNISVLFQDFVKYELSLRENIGLSNLKQLTDERIKQCMETIGLDFLKQDVDYNLNQRLGTWFNDSRQLSGGQWQKVALARTFFKNASIYILDEPSSALDPISEKEVFDDFIHRSANSISLFVSHSLSAAKKADRIIVMKDGRIINEGKHEDLLKASDYYRELYYSERYEEISNG